MTDKKLEQLLQSTLAPVEPNEDLNRNLKRKMEDRCMKHFSVKKAAVLAAACCLLVGTASLASSGAFSSVSHSRAGEYTDFSKLKEVEERVGYQFRTLEQFANGYEFSYMSVVDGQNLDEAGNEMNRYKGVDIFYEKAGADALSLNMNRKQDLMPDMEEKTPEAAKEIGGITVSYYVDTYKWVPADYKLTPEDEANMQKDNYYISYGASEVSENKVSCAIWEQDGIRYNLMDIRNALPAETFFEMAQELITAS